VSESAIDSSAWKVPPARYLAGRPQLYKLPQHPISKYVEMSDGCRIAIDIYLPEQAPAGTLPPGRFPTIAIMTCYYRRHKLKAGSEGVDPSPNAGRYRDFFVPRGYCVVVVDVRGTGASFGTRDGFRSPQERKDFGELAEWIASQPWSDGTIGATGISYPGAASTFLASTGHPAVKAVAPLFSVWDTFADHLFPAGIPLARLAEANNDMMRGLDENRPELLSKFAYFSHPAFDGPQPVDDDLDGALRDEACDGHKDNFVMTDFLAEFRFSDDSLPYDPDFTPASISPSGYADGFRDGVAVYSISGWYDGAGFSNSSILRFLSLPNTRRHLLLGPWDHGARTNISPWREGVVPRFELMGELLRFFDHYLMGLSTGLENEEPVHYFAVHDEAWHAAPRWPVETQERSFHLDADDRTLTADAADAGSVSYRSDFARGSGTNTRYERLAAKDCKEYYPSWAEQSRTMLSFETEPLPALLKVVGHPLLYLRFASSEADAAIFAYLSEVDETGKAYYVTEGILRALHRRESDPPPNYRATWPYRSLSGLDAVPMTGGNVERVRFAFFPIAWSFRKGSRIRISFAGADADHFVQVPHGRPPIITIFSGEDGSSLHLPVAG